MTRLDPISPTQIEKEIQKELSAVSAAFTRAGLFNLIIFKQASQKNPVEASLNYLLGKRPARIIHIESGFSGPSRAHVSARCYPYRKDSEVCFQEIHIRNGADNIGRDPGFWSPLIIREIPVYIWWLEPLIPFPELFRKTDETADRFLIYSSYNEEPAENPLSIFRSLCAWGDRGYGTSFSDFSWHRILPLRIGTARLFDPVAERIMLTEIASLCLSGGSSSEALLYSFWLAARLGWEAREIETDGLSFRDSGRKTVKVRHEKKTPLENGYMIEFEIRDGKKLSLRSKKEGCVTLTRPDSECQTMRLPVPGPGEILLKEVDSLKADLLFYEAIKATGKLPNEAFA